MKRQSKWDKLFEELRQRTYEAMANPKPNCERCQHPIDLYNRQWTGNIWACYKCAEEMGD